MKKLIIGKLYQIEYIPTKYLYKREGILISQTEESLKFDLQEEDGSFFTVRPEHIITINQIS